MHFYQRLRDLREDKDMTQADMSEVLGITRQQYQLYESGRREMPFALIIAFGKYFDVSLDYIAGRTNDKRGIGFSPSKEEGELIKMFNSLDRAGRNRVLGYLTAITENAGKRQGFK